MSSLKIEKVINKPDIANITPNTLYITYNADDTFDTYITDKDGTKLLPLNKTQDIVHPFLLLGVNNVS